MIVRTARAEDAPVIARIHVETWQKAYRGQAGEKSSRTRQCPNLL